MPISPNNSALAAFQQSFTRQRLARIECLLTLLWRHGGLDTKVACAACDRSSSQRGVFTDIARNTSIDDAQSDIVLSRQHVDRRAALEIVQQHLRRDGLRIGADAIGGDAMIARKDKQLRRVEYWRLGI